MPLDNAAKFDSNERKDFELLPVGQYSIEVQDVELKEDTYDKENPKMKLNFTFGVLGDKHKGRKLWRNVVPWAGSAILQEIFTAAYGRAIKPEEITPESTNALIGKKMLALVGTKPKQAGGTKNIIVNFMADPNADLSSIPF